MPLCKSIGFPQSIHLVGDDDDIKRNGKIWHRGRPCPPVERYYSTFNAHNRQSDYTYSVNLCRKHYVIDTVVVGIIPLHPGAENFPDTCRVCIQLSVMARVFCRIEKFGDCETGKQGIGGVWSDLPSYRLHIHISFR